MCAAGRALGAEAATLEKRLGSMLAASRRRPNMIKSVDELEELVRRRCIVS